MTGIDLKSIVYDSALKQLRHLDAEYLIVKQVNCAISKYIIATPYKITAYLLINAGPP